MSDRNQRHFSADEPTAASRSRIQQGLEGDKVPGFDPAAAPMETDSEAGIDDQRIEDEVQPSAIFREEPAPVNASGHGTAMRKFAHEDKAAWPLSPVILLVLLAALALIIAVLVL